MATIVIPARWGSSRYPGKPLAALHGANGRSRSLIERSWLAACAVPGDHRIVVATDDERIVAEIEALGGEAVMTSRDCANGTERVAEIASSAEEDEIFVNLQGDALLTPPDFVARLIDTLQSDSTVDVATVAVHCNAGTYAHLVEDQKNGRVGGTTVVADARNDALYFSKRIIPYMPEDMDASAAARNVKLHLGLYAYRQQALKAYVERPRCEYEVLEGLEQLGFLNIGTKVRVTMCDTPGWDVVELNNPSDVEVIERILKEREID
jgi:3-deoxy-manno-octulosonate cytidylyltransferase (CMP-KDO synthetase)